MGTSIENSRTLGSGQVKFDVHEIPPGKMGAPYHFQHLNEEVFIILEGEATTLRQNNKSRIVKELKSSIKRPG